MILGRGLGLIATAGFFASAAAQVPEAMGPFGFTTITLRLPVEFDPAGVTGTIGSIAADLYLPEGAGGAPLIVQYPGLMSDKRQLANWGRHFASWGFVVIIPNSRAGVPSFDFNVNTHDMLRLLRWAVQQTDDPASPFFRKIDPSRLCVSGHSSGGYLAARVAELAEAEGPKLSAVLLLDPLDVADLARNGMSKVKTPVAVIAAEEFLNPSVGAPKRIFDALQAPKFGIRVSYANHFEYEDPSQFNFVDPASIHTVLFHRYSAAFLRYYLKDEEAMLDWIMGCRPLEDQAAGLIAIFDGSMRLADMAKPCQRR